MDINEIWVIYTLFFFLVVEKHISAFQWVPCTIHGTHKPHFLAKFSLKMDLTALFTHLKIILLQYFQFSIFCNPFFPTNHDYHHITIGYQHGSCAHQMAWQLGIKQIIKWVSLSHHNQVLFLQIDPKRFCPSQFGLYQKHQTPMPLGLVKLRPSFITLNFSWTLCFLWWKHSLLTNQE